MKPSVRTELLAALTALLTALSLIPYELGEVANILPPDFKKWLVIVGAFATVFLKVLNVIQKTHEKAAEEKAVVKLAKVVSEETAEKTASAVLQGSPAKPAPPTETTNG